ncbi:O-antigen ligase family protein [Aerococcaceae bacterium DSM 111176]|nr:O-antigen ligase family protein [Aerococcaceae bacterium DSM 111176]
MTFYRLAIFGLLGVTLIQLLLKHDKLRVHPKTVSTLAAGTFVFWWLWALISGVWAVDKVAWLQSLFLLTLGVGAILLMYLHIHRMHQWKLVVYGIWFMMTLLLLLGVIEITFNVYLLADLGKLDKYGTFNTQPLTRMPITIFENQNDYATMLLAYLPLNFILFKGTRYNLMRILTSVLIVLGTYLIYRTQSRLVLLSALIFLFIMFIQLFKWDIKTKVFRNWIIVGGVTLTALILLVPQLRSMVSGLIYTGGIYDLSGDEVRINLWRNGFLFLAQTFGFGVGAGNIETWMGEFAFYPVENIVNMHNWWLEILTGYGIIVFVLYVVMYGLLIHKLHQLRHQLTEVDRVICQSFIAFLIAFAFASITSANNMLIEWHWVYFGLIISYIKLAELRIYKRQSTTLNHLNSKRSSYEFSNNY